MESTHTYTAVFPHFMPNWIANTIIAARICSTTSCNVPLALVLVVLSIYTYIHIRLTEYQESHWFFRIESVFSDPYFPCKKIFLNCRKCWILHKTMLSHILCMYLSWYNVCSLAENRLVSREQWHHYVIHSYVFASLSIDLKFKGFSIKIIVVCSLLYAINLVLPFSFKSTEKL